MNNPIDCEKPTHQINDVLFDVKLQEVYSNSKLPGYSENQSFSTQYYKAVVDRKSVV